MTQKQTDRSVQGAPAVLAEGVTKRYGERPALAHVDLAVDPGEIVGLLGPNGAGKTTLVEIIAGLRRPDSGVVHVNRVDVSRHPARARRLIGLAPQHLGVYPRATVAENLVFFAGYAGMPRAESLRRVREVADAMGLAPLLDHRAHTLSGGQQRRLHAAAAMVHRPPLLVLDEPTVGSDIETRHRLLEVVRSLAADGTAVLYTTHYLPELETLEASLAILDSGQVVARGTQDALIAQYGGGILELVFDGPPPDITFDGAVSTGSSLRLRADDPGRAAAATLTRLGPEARRVRSIDLVRPGLEAVYLSLTGRRAAAEVEEVGQDAA